MGFENHEADVRKRFPALQQNQVFLDNAGGSQALDTVISTIQDYYINANVQIGATYAVGKAATDAYSKGYAAASAYINAEADEVVIGPSTTQLFRNLSYALRFRPGDEIVVSAIDHETNIAPWLDLAERQDLVVKWWRPKPSTNPELLPTDLKPLLSSRTRLVTFTHASNILGTITDVRAIADLAHEYGALVCVDGVAYAPHRPIDVKALEVDFYSFSWYKVYGPHISMLYASWSAQSQLKSLGHFFNPTTSLADKIGLAGGSYELITAIPSVVSYLHQPDRWSNIAAHEGDLQTAFIKFLKAHPSNIIIYGVPDGNIHSRVPTISFTIKGLKNQNVVEAVERETNFAFRWGTFYSNRLIRETLQLSSHGVIRVSMVHYNTMEEVQGLIKALEKVLSGEIQVPS